METIRDQARTLSGEDQARRLMDLWQEYEQHETVEAVIVHDLDKWDMVLQAAEYEKRHGKLLDSFFESTRGVFRVDCIREWDHALRQNRTCSSNNSDNA
jgi:putative hydrolase of HD superfamily